MTLTLAIVVCTAMLCVTILALWVYLCQYRTGERLLTELRESNRKVLLLSEKPAAQQSAALTAPDPGRSNHEPEVRRRPTRMMSS